jgi:hypothetical protein
MCLLYLFVAGANHAANSLNHVRLPVGYWAFEVGAGEPYISGQLPYVQRAVGWAQKYGLKVVFDLHGKLSLCGPRFNFPCGIADITFQAPQAARTGKDLPILELPPLMIGNPLLALITRARRWTTRTCKRSPNPMLFNVTWTGPGTPSRATSPVRTL